MYFNCGPILAKSKELLRLIEVYLLGRENGDTIELLSDRVEVIRDLGARLFAELKRNNHEFFETQRVNEGDVPHQIDLALKKLRERVERIFGSGNFVDDYGNPVDPRVRHRCSFRWPLKQDWQKILEPAVMELEEAVEYPSQCLSVETDCLNESGQVKNDEVVQLSPSVRAYLAYCHVESVVATTKAKRPTDAQVYEYIQNHGSDEYDLPRFDTWRRYVRIARNTLGRQKNQPRAGRQARSVISPRMK